MRESCFKGLSFLYCSIMILKDTDRKEVYIVKTARREIEGRGMDSIRLLTGG